MTNSTLSNPCTPSHLIFNLTNVTLNNALNMARNNLLGCYEGSTCHINLSRNGQLIHVMMAVAKYGEIVEGRIDVREANSFEPPPLDDTVPL